MHQYFIFAVYLWLVAVVKSTKTCTNVHPSPTNSICFKNGTAKVPADFRSGIQPTILSSFTACRNVAFEIGATSYSWNHVNRHCRFYYSPLESSNFTANPKSPVEYADFECSECTGICPAPVAANQLTNPGFELSGKFVGPWGVPYEDQMAAGPDPFSIVSPGHNSPHALKAELSSILEQRFNYFCNGEYFLTYDYKFTATKSVGADFTLGYYLLEAFFNNKINRLSNTTWTTVQDYAFSSYAGADPTPLNLNMSGLDNTGIAMLLDNFGVLQIAAPVVLSGAKENVVNGGFETGKLAPFTSQSDPAVKLKVVSPGLNGSSHALRVTSGGAQKAFFAQNVTLTPGAHYLLSFDYSYDASNALPFVVIYLQIAGGDSNSLFGSFSGLYGGDMVYETGQYTFSRRFVAHSTVSMVQIEIDWQFEEDPPSKYKPVLIDSISIKEIQKPPGA